MIQKNIYAWILPILVLLFIGSIIIIEVSIANDLIRLKTNEKTIFFSGTVLFGILCIAFCLVMFVKNQTQLIQDAFINCLVEFKADPQFIQKVKKSHFDIKEPGTWEKGTIFFAGESFDISIENILGPSKLGYRSYLVLSKKYNSTNFKQTITEIAILKQELSKRLGLIEFELLCKNQTVWIKLPMTSKLKFDHLSIMVNFLKEKFIYQAH
nr:hypothetical protein [uncultured Desulfobacter sp.]